MSFVFGGKSYRNLKDACKANGKNYATVRARLEAGKSLAEAFSGNKREFEYRGTKYRSMKAAAEANGLDYRTVWNRLKLGKSVEEAFSQRDLPKTGRSTPIIINGQEYSAVSVAARAFGVKERTIHGRLERGLTPEQAVGLEPFEVGTEKSIKVGEITFPSIAEAARHFEVPIYSVHNRIKRGRSLEDIFFKGELKRKSPLFRAIKVADLEFEQLKDACEYFDVGYQQAQYRIRKKWTLEQVFELHPAPEKKSKTAPKKIKFKGKQYASASELAKEFDVSEGNLTRRLKDGWKLEEALGLVEREWKNKPQEYKIKGHKFKTRNEAARYFGVNIGTVATRTNRLGWTIEQALELVPPPEGFHADFGAVYLVTNNQNDMKYVGITLTNPPRKRFEGHLGSAKVIKERRAGSLAEAIYLHGEVNFSFEVIDTAKTQAGLQELEKKYISQYKTLHPDGYNLSKGGTIGRVPGRTVEIPSLGLKFKSVADAARHFNIDAGALLYRMDKGYTPEQCVGIEPLDWSHPGSVIVEIDGLSFKTIKDAALHFGHPPSRIRNRMHTGWSIEKALKTPFVSRSKPISIDGISYPSQRQAARELGLTHETIRWRFRRKNSKSV